MPEWVTAREMPPGPGLRTRRRRAGHQAAAPAAPAPSRGGVNHILAMVLILLSSLAQSWWVAAVAGHPGAKVTVYVTVQLRFKAKESENH